MADLQTPTPATPSVSVESEEYVLVPREPTERMLKAADGWTDLIDGAGENTAESRRSEFQVAWRAMITAAPAPNPSPAAKSGEAGAVVRPLEWDHLETISTAEHSWGRYEVYPHGDYMPGRWTTGSEIGRDFPSKEAAIAAVEASHLERTLDLIDFALATPSPQPADAVREALRPPYPICNSYMPDYQAGGDCVTCGRMREDHAEFAALTEPAPAGEAVEPIEDRIDNAVQAMSETHHSWEARCHAIMAALGFNFGWADPKHDEDPTTSNTARLREDLERVTRERDEAREQYVNKERYWINHANSITERADTAERDRDDARKALEAITEALTPSGGTKAEYIGEFFEEVEFPNPEYDEDDEESEGDETVLRRVYIQWETVKEIMNAIKVRAARSASREATR